MAYDFLEELEEELLQSNAEHLDLNAQQQSGSSQAIHDHLQFQADFDFDLSTAAGEKQKVYSVDTYIYLPKNMGVSRDSFSREQFYTAMTNYLRIRTPIQPEDDDPLASGILESAERYFHVHLISHLRQPLEALVVQDVKLFGCYLNAQLKQLQLAVLQWLRQQPARANQQRLIEKRLLHTVQCLVSYRTKYMGRVRHQAYLIDAEVEKAFLLVDEYLSYRLEAVLIYILQQLDTGQEHQSRLAEMLASVLTSEMEYRESENLLLLDASADRAQRETYYYRLGLLKKYVSDVLFLQIKNVRKDRTYRNLVAAAGAALAAFWAGVIDLQRFYYLAQVTQGDHNGANSDFALRFFFIVIVGVVAYIFKDRIKEVSREYFYERLKKHLPDYEYEMNYAFYDHASQSAQELKVGKSRQFMRFIHKATVVPEISYTREIGHHLTLEPDRQEHVLHYAHSMRLDSQLIAEHSEQMQVLKNIMRFSVAPLLEKLDEPDKNLRYFDREKGIGMIKAPKVYHVNVIFRYASTHQNAQGKWSDEQVELERIRLIVNKEGIQRIETIIPRGTLGYTGSRR